MQLLLIGCEVIQRELRKALALSPNKVDVHFLSMGLHALGARSMQAALQQEIDCVTRPYDAIVLGYGLCGNGLAGLQARSIPLVLPRAHDCITLLMGSRYDYKEYFQNNPGVYFRSLGWIEHGGELEPLFRSRNGAGFTLEGLIEQYGEDNGRYLFEELTRYRQNYTKLTFIETGAEPDKRFESRARSEAADRGWKFEIYKGNLGLFVRLLAGRWEDDFLIIPPGHRIAVCHDEKIIKAEKVE